jgi:ABC-2 type transport system permease protein
MRLLLHEFRGEQKLYWRSRELAFFTFLLPIVIFVLLGSVYGNDTIDHIKGSWYLLAGMLGYGVVATTFAGLSIVLVIRREDGILKRLRATPLPAWAYIGAVLGSTLLVFAIEAVALVLIGRAAFSVPVPHRLFSLVLVLLLSGLAFTALGLALTALVRSAEGSSAVVNAIYLPMLFISGSFFSTHSSPRFLRAIADVLPLTYVIRLARDVMWRGAEIWSRPGWVAVIAAWGAIGVAGAIRGFRWEPHGQG